MSVLDIESRIWDATAAANLAAASSLPKSLTTGSFSTTLQSTLALQAAQVGVTFSGHAQARLASRQITLTPDEISRLGTAMTRAAQKGARESLVMMDNAALVVSVPNRTVITAVDKSSLKDNIFTNIDSAMIL